MPTFKNIIAIPVVDGQGNFLGAVTAHSIVDIMHKEHVEDALLTAGIRGGSNVVKLAAEHTGLIVRSRAPWLVFGLLVGLGLGFISSRFEESLQRTVAIAYFIPVVAYIADSVGTQSEAIAVRALAMLKVNQFAYLFKELLVGLVLGLIVGTLGGIGAMLIASSTKIWHSSRASLICRQHHSSRHRRPEPYYFQEAWQRSSLREWTTGDCLAGCDKYSGLLYIGDSTHLNVMVAILILLS